MFAFFLLLPLWYWVRGKRAIFALPMAEGVKAASGGLISLAAYGAIIWAMQANAMGAISALRETSVVFAALLGAVFLNERLTRLRIAACCIIAAGAACVGWRA
jgi:drug/metabolite transporter (DMT)-like permease